MELVETSLRSLEWDRFLGQYSEFCASLPAQLRAKGLEIPSDQSLSESLLALSQEGLNLLEEDFAFIAELPEMAQAFQRLAKETCLGGQELYSFALLIHISRAVRRFFKKSRNQEKYSHFYQSVDQIRDFSLLYTKIVNSVEPNGTIKDGASPKLLELRRLERRCHDRARYEIEKVLKKIDKKEGQYFDIREGRYVVLVGRERQSQVPGICFDSSSSDRSIYIEPFSLRNWNDKIRQAQIDIEEEIYKILKEITQTLIPEVEGLYKNYERVVFFDLSLARSRMAQAFASYKHVAPFSFASPLKLLDIYHPLLRSILKPDAVITNSITLSDTVRAVVISGPNTGGKTVLLKAIGLLSLMGRCGFLLPCSQGSTLPYFKKVLVHIGDEQNIEESLSSFSSSIQRIKEILQEANGETLVLIDEILSSTDPSEAVALSGAILTELARKGATSFVTTHFSGLKELEGLHFMSASMEFDRERMEPQYRLRLGIPGRSFALETARRLSLPSPILRDAAARLGGLHRQMDQLLNKIETKEGEMVSVERRLSAKELYLDQELERVEQLKKKVIEERQHLKEKFQNEVEQIKKRAFREAESIVEEYKGKIAALPSLHREAARGKRRLVEAKSTRVPEVLKEETLETELKERVLEKGAMVQVKNLRMKGNLLSDPALKEKQAEVQVGNMKVRTSWEQLIALEKAKEVEKPSGFVASTILCPPELNLIGLCAEEAIARLEEFLDSAVRSTRLSARIIHGHGNGVLKRAVREFLENTPYAVRFRPCAREEGGDGATLIEWEDV